LVDDDRVELSNLNRQVLFSEDQVGQEKTKAAAETLRRHNSQLEITTHERRIRASADLAELLDGVSVVIATADWPPHELPRWVNEACLGAGVPFITGGQFPPRLRVGPLVIPGQTPCVECLENAVRRDYALYDELAAHRARRSMPDAAIATTSGVIGCLLASEVQHLLVGQKPASEAAALTLDLQTFAAERQPIERDPACRACSG
jgi:molybdopterin/thiamine biosynthesis adenylyltransferase